MVLPAYFLWLVSVDIEKLKQRQLKLYKSIGRVYSPALKDYVYFTSEGFQHLTHKSNRIARPIKEQYLKLSLLSFVVEAVTCTLSIAALRKYTDQKFNMEMYALRYKINREDAIRVIIKRVNKGSYKFLSVMPNENRSKTKKRPKASFSS